MFEIELVDKEINLFPVIVPIRFGNEAIMNILHLPEVSALGPIFLIWSIIWKNYSNGVNCNCNESSTLSAWG